MSSTRIRVRSFWPVAAGTSAAAVATQTTTLFQDGNILAGDTAVITPANAGAAALEGGATGVYATVQAGQVTVNHAAAAGGELWHVVVIPQGMI